MAQRWRCRISHTSGPLGRRPAEWPTCQERNGSAGTHDQQTCCGLLDPAGQKYPGWHEPDTAVAPTLLQNDDGVHARQLVISDAPKFGLNMPTGQATGAVAPWNARTSSSCGTTDRRDYPTHLWAIGTSGAERRRRRRTSRCTEVPRRARPRWADQAGTYRAIPNIGVMCNRTRTTADRCNTGQGHKVGSQWRRLNRHRLTVPIASTLRGIDTKVGPVRVAPCGARLRVDRSGRAWTTRLAKRWACCDAL